MPLWARLRRGGENDGAGRRSHGREADGRPGGAQRNAARDFARQTQKVGPVTGRAVSRSEMRPNGSKRRGFAVGDPARRRRDGNGKIAVRGGEAMAAKRTTAQGGFAQRNAAPDFARQLQKVGPMTGQPGFAAGEMRPNGSKGRGESGSRVWEKRKAPAFAGPITSLRRPTFLALRK